MMIRHRLFAVLATLPLIGVVQPSVAQDAPPQAPPQQQMPAVQSGTVDKFAQALVDIRGIQDRFSAQLEGVDSQERAAALQAKAREDMVEAVEDAGLSVEQYNQISQQMSQDQTLRQRIMDKVEDIEEEAAG